MELLRTSLLLLLSAVLAYGRAPHGPWDAFNYAPKSKTVYPAAIHSLQGSVKDSQRLVLNAGSATISTRGSWVALDYGVEVSDT
jgi:hypothetical protein